MTGPTVLTIVRIILASTLAIFVMLPAGWAKVIALVLFVVAAITDKIDGAWARKTNQVTELGAFLDPLADKILVNLALLTLVYQNVVPLWVFAAILVRDFAVDGVRMAAARHKVTIAASVIGKLKTACQMLALAIILLGLVLADEAIVTAGNVVLYIALALTVVSGIDYLAKGYRNFMKPKK